MYLSRSDTLFQMVVHINRHLSLPLIQRVIYIFLALPELAEHNRSAINVTHYSYVSVLATSNKAQDLVHFNVTSMTLPPPLPTCRWSFSTCAAKSDSDEWPGEDLCSSLATCGQKWTPCSSAVCYACSTWCRGCWFPVRELPHLLCHFVVQSESK